jgi:3'-phosphoadenosine 5'-phosphosulfate sulfotransferase (PAPS reductase)/FAD synthetase
MEKARNIIRQVLNASEQAAVLCSFGKESLLLLALAREVCPEIQAIWFKAGLTKAQQAFAMRIIRDWDLEVWSWEPTDVYALPNGGGITLVREYAFGERPLPSLLDVENGPGCVLDFPAERTESFYPHFDTYLIGTRDEDEHPVLGKDFNPPDGWTLGRGKVFSPLRHLTEAEVWAAIRELGIPYDTERYDRGGKDPDSYLGCSSCLQAGETATVYCPKADERIPRRNWRPEQRLREFRHRYGFKEAA